MLIHPIEKFLTNGSGTLPPGDWRAIAIHPSSEVDLVFVAGTLLSPGMIIPITRDPKLVPVRNAPTAIETGVTFADVTGHDPTRVGQQLIVQLYEACDALVPPPQQLAPAIRQASIASTSIVATASSTGALVMRVPMAGRDRCRVTFRRTTSAADLNLQGVAVNWGLRSAGLLTSGAGVLSLAGHIKEATAITWWNGGGAASVNATAGALAVTGPQLLARSYNFGGAGDSAETMDELLIFIWGAAGGGAEISAEAR